VPETAEAINTSRVVLIQERIAESQQQDLMVMGSTNGEVPLKIHVTSGYRVSYRRTKLLIYFTIYNRLKTSATVI
jgi:hypothetical protein